MQLVDPSNRTAIDYGVYGPPETFFIDQNGTVVRKRIGAMRWDAARATIDSLLAESPVAESRDQNADLSAANVDDS